MNNLINFKEITIRDTITALFRHKILIIVTILVILIFTFIALIFRTPVYEATVKMYIRGQGMIESTTYRGIGAFRIHFTQMEILKTNPVIKRAVKALKLDERSLDYEKQFCHEWKKSFIDYQLKKTRQRLNELDEAEKKRFFLENAIKNLKKNISTQLLPNADIFILSVTDFDPHQAIAIANVVSRSYSIFDQQQQLAELRLKYGELHPSVRQLRDNIQLAEKNLSGENLPYVDAIGTASVKIIEQATSTHKPVGKSKKLIFAVAFLISLFVGVGLALMFNYIDQSFKSPNDIVSFLDIPFLGSIPNITFWKKKLINNVKSSTRYISFYRDLSDELYTFLRTQNLKTILVTSVLPQRGSTPIVENLGLLLANDWGSNVLIIDANLQNSAVHKNFNIEKNAGLYNMLDGESSNMIQNVSNKLDVLPAGECQNFENSIKLLHDKKIDDIIKSAENEYDIVLIDCTKMNNFKDSVILSSRVDGVVLVVNEDKERRQVVKSSINSFNKKNVNLIGAILNNRKFVIPKVIYDLL